MAKQQIFGGRGQLAARALALGVGLTAGLGAYPPPPTQAQVARRFLREILRADYSAAYHRLAPEVQVVLRPAAFATAAQPLWHQGQARGQALELYKLSTQLGGRSGRGQWHYSFSFAHDSAHRPPPVLLEVTFRDTTTRAVLGFGLRRR